VIFIGDRNAKDEMGNVTVDGRALALPDML
jgi:hypothetical protein